MGQIEDLRAFVQIVELGSIGKAAEAAGIAKSAMSRKLRLLEERLQTELIVRTTRQWALTEAGRQYYERGQDVLLTVDELDTTVRNDSTELRGQIRISVPLYFGQTVLSSLLLEFAEKHPAVHLKVDFTDRMIDVVRENYDFVVRIANLPDSSLIARKLCETQHVICASPEYLSARPAIKKLRDLSLHPIIQFGSSRRFKWIANTVGGKHQSVSLTSTLNTNDGAFLVKSAEQGLGVTRVPKFIADPSLKSGKLNLILDHLTHEPRGVFTVYPSTRYLPARTRALMNFLVDRVSGTE